ncbi:lanthionine synthetase LanC family protein [[Empedobacter] haloabium]|uniref:Lanthionine synthetase LanC family protein n=1 Tax=[Empedobacter] haloabium TaxID=592317 RepID=A0ABZ1UH62_9BURK
MSPADLNTEEAQHDAMLARPEEISLANGAAGTLLLQAHLYGLAPTAARRARIAETIEVLVAAVQSRDLPVTLWTGLVGILYAFEYAHAVDPALLPSPVAAFVADIDELLAGYVARRDASLGFDLITGLAGIGTYALMRSDGGAARELYRTVESVLAEQSESAAAGRVWRTAGRFLGPLAPAESRKHGHVDLGVAHGLPGVVLLLAGALRHGLATGDTTRYLREGAAALVALRGEPVDGACYPYYSSQRGGSRLAWCYGDLSVGFALHAAGAALSDPALGETAHVLVAERLAQPDESFGLADHALCHGHAGVLHLVGKMARERAEPVYLRRMAAWRAAIADGAQPLAGHTGLLEGSGGVLLALQDGVARGRHHWDVCLCMGF